MPSFIAPTALLPGGWADDVLLDVGPDGFLTSVQGEARGRTAGAERLAGPVVPGVPNLHSHAFQRGMAGLTERGSGSGDTFWSWREVMYAFVGTLGPDDVEAIAAQLFVEMLQAGYTSVVEFHYLHHDPRGRPYDDPLEMSHRVGAAARRAGIALVHLPVLYQRGGFDDAPVSRGQRRFVNDTDAYLRLVADLGRSWADDRDRSVGLAFHSLRAVGAEALSEVLESQATEAPEPVHIHVAEQVAEVEECLAARGARPVEWLLDRAPVSPRWCLVHATHLTPAEVSRLAGTGAVAGLCPTTEANLGDGLFPLAPYLAEGGRFGVGSDSHVSVSPVEELRWLEYGQRLSRQARNVAAGPAGSTGATLLEGALAGGAGASGRRTGRLEPGAAADFVVLDGASPILAGRSGDRIADSWIFSGNRSAVRDVMVRGVWAVRDGRHEVEGAVAADYGRAMARIAAAL